MSPHQLSSRLISEVQQVVQSYVPRLPNTDREQLTTFANAVLASVDVRDLRGVAGEALTVQLEQLLDSVRHRRKDEICINLRPGRSSDWLVIEVCIADQPFLVSTMRALFAAEGIDVHRFLNAIVLVQRDAEGELVGVGHGQLESMMRIEVEGIEHVPEGLERRMHHRLTLAQAMVRDFQAMKARVVALADTYLSISARLQGDHAIQLREAEALLRWLCDENFVFLSVEDYDQKGSCKERLGISVVQDPARDRALLQTTARGETLVCYRRSAEESPVHRAGKPGHFIVPKFDDTGMATSAVVVHGLFTYKALHQPPEEIPLIRLNLNEMLADRKVSVDSHRGKSMTNAFNALPLEYLLAASKDAIWELTDRVLRAEAEGGSDVHIRIGDGSRYAFVVVALPRSQFSEELRQDVQKILLDELGATYADYGVYIDRYDNAVVHYYVTGVGALREVDTEALRRQILAHARGWNERLREAIAELVREDEIGDLFELYENAFRDEHKRRASVARLKGDIACLENIRRGADIDCDLYVSEFGEHPGTVNLRIFSRTALNLSRELPVLSHFGFEVIDEYSRSVHLPHLSQVDMDNFRFDVPEPRIGHVMGRRGEIVTAIRGVFSGRYGDDDLNRLVVVGNLDAHEVEILRAYLGYLRQLRLPFEVSLIRSTLVDHPTVTQAFVRLLASRFDPEHASDAAAEAALATLRQELKAVVDYTADRVLQAVAEAVLATRRTNAYVAKTDEGEALAFKIASGELSYGPEPKPHREIWVYHRDFEGVHLRGGKIARGGIRFSDRPDDFRTEIHGLMATQMVKNVVIVPVGAKGGFVLRSPPTDRDALRAAGDHYYGLFVRALLSLTDNVVDGKVVTPSGILHTGVADPYLVVAADKGTAHLSDTANGISMEQHFWLDDAFASGGSNGYDHKATGITARGAWEVVKRSFRELGIDPETDPITAVGVGDMSGDVFGNGLLRSRTIKLLAAFNHVHIFVDPTPDPEASFRERARLFELPRSQWSDYDPQLLSSGGGVYPRKSKEIPLSAAARSMLGFGAEQVVNGDEVMRAILRMDVDLVWMGGIGTYVKSRNETHAEVGDKTNDNARVDATTMRCRVFAEGANLAITDRGRVELARRRAQNYNAFLDNSGGVDTSDHEVNIKILFAPLLTAGKVTRERRNEVLRAVELEVVEAVLDNNRSQSRMVSYDVTRSRADVFRYARTLSHLQHAVPFNGEAFALPSEDELTNRARKGEGLHKCEAAVVCAHAKMYAYRELLEGSEALDQALTSRMLRAYFPPAVVEAVKGNVDDHLLRREIATTMLVNRIVDNAGCSFFSELGSATGCSVQEIASAYMDAVAVAGVEELQDELYALEDKHNQAGVYRAMGMLQNALEDATHYLLDQPDGDPLTAEALSSARALLTDLAKILPENLARHALGSLQPLVEAGLPPAVAERVARVPYLTPVLDAARLSASLDMSARDALVLRLRVADRMKLTQLKHAIDGMGYTSPWDGPAANALGRRLNFHLHNMVRLAKDGDVDGFIQRHGLERVRKQIQDQLDSSPTISSLVMLDDDLRRMLAHVPSHPTG